MKALEQVEMLDFILKPVEKKAIERMLDKLERRKQKLKLSLFADLMNELKKQLDRKDFLSFPVSGIGKKLSIFPILFMLKLMKHIPILQYLKQNILYIHQQVLQK